jgi:hypothetical protein
MTFDLERRTLPRLLAGHSEGAIDESPYRPP